MALMRIETGANKGKQLRLPNRGLVVGRGETADMRINSAEISREHCRLTAEGSEVVAEDLGSSNGTFVNGRPITEATRMKQGDRVTFGPITLRLLGVRKPKSDEKKPAPDDSKLVDPSVVAKARKISDDDVSSWLNEEAEEKSDEHEDTKILNSAAADAVQKQVKKQSDYVFGSVAEEAADIIRRHYEAVGESS